VGHACDLLEVAHWRMRGSRDALLARCARGARCRHEGLTKRGNARLGLRSADLAQSCCLSEPPSRDAVECCDATEKVDRLRQQLCGDGDWAKAWANLATLRDPRADSPVPPCPRAQIRGEWRSRHCAGSRGFSLGCGGRLHADRSRGVCVRRGGCLNACRFVALWVVRGLLSCVKSSGRVGRVWRLPRCVGSRGLSARWGGWLHV
jgi:hypothetical protein